MKANELLLWLSARREGSWQVFRGAVDQLHSIDGESASENAATPVMGEFPVHHHLRLVLERLGHVEFFACGCEEGWRVAPPTLAVHPLPDGFRGVLSGGRSPALVERVIRTAAEFGCKCERLVVDDAPDVIRLVARETSAVENVAAQAGVCLKQDAPLAILSCLPPCDAPARRRVPFEFPQGADWVIDQFDTDALDWRHTDRGCAETTSHGVFRFLLRYDRPRYFLRWRSATFQLPRAVALYVLIRRARRNVVRYDGASRVFSVPARCKPPQLLDRALVLCSGMPPAYNKTNLRLAYADVPPDIARFAAELLRQPLE